MPAAATTSNKVADHRRENLRALMKKHEPQHLAAKLGYANSSFLVQMAGPNPTRPVTEKSAAKFEQALELPAGALSEPPQTFAQYIGVAAPVATHTTAAPIPAGDAVPVDQVVPMVLDVVTLVQRISRDEQVSLPEPKFADLVAMAFRDSVEHGGPRQDFVRSILRLVK